MKSVRQRGVNMKGTLIKVILWRCISVSITLLVIYLVTGNIKESTGMTMVLHGVLATCHFLFESAWKRFYENKSTEFYL